MLTDSETWERERLMESLDSYRRGVSDAPYLRKWTGAPEAAAHSESGAGHDAREMSFVAVHLVGGPPRRRHPPGWLAAPVLHAEPGVPVGPRLHPARHRQDQRHVDRGPGPARQNPVRAHRFRPGGGDSVPGRVPEGGCRWGSGPSSMRCGGTQRRGRWRASTSSSRSCWRSAPHLCPPIRTPCAKLWMGRPGRNSTIAAAAGQPV